MLRSRYVFVFAVLALAATCLVLLLDEPSTSQPSDSIERSAQASQTSETATATPLPTTTSTTPLETISEESPPTIPTTTPTTAPPPPPPITAQLEPEHEPVVPATAAPATPVACGGWQALIAAHFPADQVTRACRVMMCESNGNPTAQNPRSSASGLFQFLDGTWRSARGMVGADQYARAMYAPAEVQIAAAGAWWRATSWSQWQCR